MLQPCVATLQHNLALLQEQLAILQHEHAMLQYHVALLHYDVALPQNNRESTLKTYKTITINELPQEKACKKRFFGMIFAKDEAYIIPAGIVITNI